MGHLPVRCIHVYTVNAQTFSYFLHLGQTRNADAKQNQKLYWVLQTNEYNYIWAHIGSKNIWNQPKDVPSWQETHCLRMGHLAVRCIHVYNVNAQTFSYFLHLGQTRNAHAKKIKSFTECCILTITITLERIKEAQMHVTCQKMCHFDKKRTALRWDIWRCAAYMCTL